MEAFDIAEIEVRLQRYRRDCESSRFRPPAPVLVDECEALLVELAVTQKRLGLAERELARLRAREKTQQRVFDREARREPVGDGEPHLITRGTREHGW